MVTERGMMTLNFATNGPEFDFPLFEGAPSIRYAIASSPRCGSNFLQRALWRAGCAGAPEEYLTAPYFADYSKRFGLKEAWPPSHALRDEYLRQLWKIRTSHNGVFGLKLHGSHLSAALGDDGEPLIALRGQSWLWIRRRNRIAQAISYLLADQTGVWIVDGDWLPTRMPSGTPQYDVDGIRSRLSQITAEEDLWDQFFSSDTPESVHMVWYEELVRDYARELGKVLEYLSIAPPAFYPDPGIGRQAGDLNKQWEERFRYDSGIDP
jgi:trehalose 2-sulfotransferase